MMALHERGHNITMLTHANEKDKENLTFIHLEGYYEYQKKYNFEQLPSEGSVAMIKFIYDWICNLCTYDLKTKGLQQFINMVKEGRKFDLVIMDVLVAYCVYPLLELMGSPPMVGTSPFGIIPSFTYTFGIDTQSSYIPIYFLMYTENMNFIQRSVNFFYVNLSNFWYRYLFLPDLTKILEEKYGKGFTPLQEMEYNVSILLANYDPVLHYPQMLPPNIIPVGGINARKGKELPEDLQLYLNESKNGVILFSLGTNIRSDKLCPEKKKVLVKTFARLKENVIWKSESDIQNLPNNVIVRKWLPQNDIQAHPNLKLFINHGGALSTHEAIFHGVPLVGIPFYADQRLNTYQMNERKLGKKIDLSDLTENVLFDAIREVIDNPIYKHNVMKLSQRYRDQPQSPLDRAVFWVEYVGRHREAKFLEVRYRQMNTFQVHHLDLFALMFLIFVVLYFAIVRICCRNARINKKLKSN